MIKEREGARRSVEKYAAAMEYLPRAVAEEIGEISRSVDSLPERISEIRLRADGLSTLTVGGVGYPLLHRVSRREIAECLSALSGAEAYAHADTLRRGFISVRGIRVGVSGFARYDGGEVRIGEVSALVFRLGGAACDFGERLYLEWRSLSFPNLLVASPPMGGKTTALRALAGYVGSGRDAKRAVVVDERCEFDPSEYRLATVDVLRGYRRAEGIEQAYRTMAAEVIIVDEIANEREAEALLAAYGAGVGLVASVHAERMGDIRERVCLGSLLRAGVFGVAAVIHREGRRYSYELSELSV